jgi:hypothetical protein
MQRRHPRLIPQGEPTTNGLLESLDNRPPRARRFAIRVPLLFRRTGQISWSQGYTENISRSGILFSSEEAVAVGTRLELTFKLRGEEVGGEEGAVVICQARMVRSVQPPATTTRALAARILDYRLMRE